ncbi:3'-5' exonuclease [Pedobacter sp. SYP-B3415]|uniref:3'-5' exonuclease n=1 Tax=Pedobacter sp. SYP-B3415 TaxID=2496641 RepID=UPI00101BA49D|nr:3'-5' exonuclease [Pedobacter sp. SYP-B3415]
MLAGLDLNEVMVIDIETVPQYPDAGAVPAYIMELWAAKTRFQRKEQTAEEFYQNAGIQAEFGKIICISAGIFNFRQGNREFRLKSFYGHDENQLLHEFGLLLSRQTAARSFCAHNGKEFDFPYLCRRLLANDLPLPKQLQLWGKKPWQVSHIDTMELWRFGDQKNFTSLNLLAAVFGIPTPKDDMDGSQVRTVYYEENNLERIVNYCQKDVVTTAQILLKFKGEPLLEEENINIIN